MKFIDFLNVLDYGTKIKVWAKDSKEDDEPLFDGYVMDCPFTLVNYNLFVELKCDGAVDARVDSLGRPFLVIVLDYKMYLN